MKQETFLYTNKVILQLQQKQERGGGVRGRKPPIRTVPARRNATHKSCTAHTSQELWSLSPGTVQRAYSSFNTHTSQGL